MQDATEKLREDQARFGREAASREGTLTVSRAPSNEPRWPSKPSGDRRPPRKFVPKGHDRILNDAQEQGTEVELLTMGGDWHRGVIIARDKFTITLRTEAREDCTFYKHGIEHFRPMPKEAA